jgi:hypothetical protein
MFQASEMPLPFSLEVAEAERKHHDEALDEGLRESFPASDPVAVSISYVPTLKHLACFWASRANDIDMLTTGQE